MALLIAVGCGSGDDETAASHSPRTTPPSSTVTTTSASVATSTVAPLPTTSAAPTTVAPTDPTLPALGQVTTPYRAPIGDGVHFSYGRTHHDYPAADIFAKCGAPVVSPVNGSVTEVRTEDLWDRATDNPALRGGKSVTIIGDDGVRYYLAHFDQIEPSLQPGPITIGAPLGTQGQTGRASACHTHFAISPACPGKEWSVRRGVIWPWSYLDSWRTNDQRSPVDEVRAWIGANPNTCTLAALDPNAADA